MFVHHDGSAERLARAQQLFAQGYFVLRWEEDEAICSSLFPDGSTPGHLREYRFPLKEDVSHDS